MWPRTDFLELLGITHPVIQAPMAGFAPPALAAAVCNAGGLGSIGCAGIPPATVRDQITALRQATNRPYNLNFFVHSHPRLDPDAAARMRTKAHALFRGIWAGAGP
jgi:nitronate monooxygenase